MNYFVLEKAMMNRSKVLVVDDELEIREIIKLHLGSEKYQIMEAENGDEATQILDNRECMANVSLILCDIRMPRMNGIECVDYIKSKVPEIPVVVITGYPDARLAAYLTGKGIEDFLVKPVEKKVLLKTVEKVLARGQRGGNLTRTVPGNRAVGS